MNKLSKILFFNDNFDTIIETDECKEIINSIESYDCYKTHNFDEAIKKFNENLYDIVIVDFSTNNGAKLLERIISVNPKQKTITINQNMVCSVSQGCDFCVKNYNRRRVIDIHNYNKILKIIGKFDEVECKYYNSFENVVSILGEIMQSFPNFVYEEKQYKIIPLTDNSYIAKELVEITSFLDKYNIKYSIDESLNIELL